MPFNPSDMTETTLRRLVDNLVRHAKAKPLGDAPKRSQLQEALAIALGWPSYHAAITELKRKTSPPSSSKPASSSSAAWVIPPASSALKDRLGHGWMGASDHPGSVQGIQGTSLILASESERKRLIQEVIELNPDKPVFVIRGPMSTIAPLQGASSLVAGFDIDKAWENQTEEGMVGAIKAILSTNPDLSPSGFEKALRVFREALRKHFPECDRNWVFPKGISSVSLFDRFLENYPEDSRDHEKLILSELRRVGLKYVNSSMRALSPDAFAALAWVETSDSSRAEFVVPNRPLSGDDNHKVLRVLERWMALNPDGLVVFDVIPLGSTLWGILSERFSHWAESGRPLWVGITSEADVPDWCLKALLNRFDRHLVSPVVAHRKMRLALR